MAENTEQVMQGDVGVEVAGGKLNFFWEVFSGAFIAVLDDDNVTGHRKSIKLSSWPSGRRDYKWGHDDVLAAFKILWRHSLIEEFFEPGMREAMFETLYGLIDNYK